MGPRKDEALRAELEQADLAIMPSHAESFGLALAEAQAAGLPVVAYHAGSVPEVIDDGVSGWLAPLHDVDRLAAFIEAATRDPDAPIAPASPDPSASCGSSPGRRQRRRSSRA